jgi:ABC-type branched-subunit amino acid transport system ATPase component
MTETAMTCSSGGDADILFDARRVTRRFGGLVAVDDVNLSVARGECVSVIGPNGAGKSTLFNLLTGIDTPDSGSVRFGGEDVTGMAPERLAARGIARTFQHGRVFGNLSVLDNVLIGAHARLAMTRRGWPVVGAFAARKPRCATKCRRCSRGSAHASRLASTSRRTVFHTRTAGVSRLHARSHCVRAFCCSTSRLPA